MPTVDTPTGPIAYGITSIAPDWRAPEETIIFHHGVGTDRDIWADWLPILATEFRCVRIDMRGCGQSADRSGSRRCCTVP